MVKTLLILFDRLKSWTRFATLTYTFVYVHS
jgi:hypothetical protein